jgi:hypothetical protein
VLITILVALALVWLQATRRAPALPVTFGVIVMVLGLITTLALIYRVLIDVPGSSDTVERNAGGFIGLAASIAIWCGGYLSIREEGVAPRDERTDVEFVPLPAPSGPLPAPSGALPAPSGPPPTPSGPPPAPSGPPPATHSPAPDS